LVISSISEVFPPRSTWLLQRHSPFGCHHQGWCGKKNKNSVLYKDQLPESFLTSMDVTTNKRKSHH